MTGFRTPNRAVGYRIAILNIAAELKISVQSPVFTKYYREKLRLVTVTNVRNLLTIIILDALAKP